MTGLHERFDRQERVEGSSDKGFGLVFAAFFTIIAAFMTWKGSPSALGWGLAAAACVIMAYGAPRLLSPLNRMWMKLGLLLFKAVNPLVMGILFLLVITPMGLLMRLFGKDFLRLRGDEKAPTYWLPRTPPGPSGESMRQQF